MFGGPSVHCLRFGLGEHLLHPGRIVVDCFDLAFEMVELEAELLAGVEDLLVDQFGVHADSGLIISSRLRGVSKRPMLGWM